MPNKGQQVSPLRVATAPTPVEMTRFSSTVGAAGEAPARQPPRAAARRAECLVHGQLQEAVAAYGLADDAEVARIWRRRSGVEAGLRVETGIQLEVGIRCVEAGMIEDVEGVGLEFHGHALVDFDVLENG